MADIHDDYSQVLSEGDPSRGRLARKKAASEKPPSMQQRRRAAAKKVMSGLPDTYEEYEAMEDKPFLPSADVEAGKGMSGVAFKSREQSRKDAANLAMRESDQQKKLDKFTSIPSSFGREVSYNLTGDEYLGGKVIEGAKDAAMNVRKFVDEVEPEAITAAAGMALRAIGNKKAQKAIDETLSNRLQQHSVDVMQISKGLKDPDEAEAGRTFKSLSKKLKEMNKDDRKMMGLIRDKNFSEKSSEYLKLKKSQGFSRYSFLKDLQDEAYDILQQAAKAGIPEARKKEARALATQLFKMGEKAVGKNAFRAASSTFPALGGLVSFLDHSSSVFERSKELPNQLAQNARAMKRPLQKRDVESSVTDQLKENSQLAEDLYSRGVLSAKLYDSLTESEESVLEE